MIVALVILAILPLLVCAGAGWGFLRITEQFRTYVVDRDRAEAADRQRLLEQVKAAPVFPPGMFGPPATPVPDDTQIDALFANVPGARVAWDPELVPVPGDPDYDEE